jgi:hypothetical protein
MSTVNGQSAPSGWPSSEPADLKLEVVVIPVANSSRSEASDAGLGWTLDADFSFDNAFRVVRLTPLGSQCSVQPGTHITGAPPGAQLDPEGTGDRLTGPDPDHKSDDSFATFEVPDGNSWLLREVTDRLSDRHDPSTTSFSSAGDLAAALHNAESARAEHQKRIGRADPDWPDLYAEYMVREQSGQEVPV